jgi:hypothetical protein
MDSPSNDNYESKAKYINFYKLKNNEVFIFTSLGIGLAASCYHKSNRWQSVFGCAFFTYLIIKTTV